MFEAFAISVMLAASSLNRAAGLLKLDWSSLQTIMERAVERGLARRPLDDVRRVGIDEKSFLRGQSYISTLTDLDASRVLEVAEGRAESDADALWQPFNAEQLARIEAVAIDMWKAFMNSARRNLPNADLVHDKFHISKHLGEAVDQVRRAEHKELKRQGDERLSGTRMDWLRNPEHMSWEQWDAFQEVRQSELKTARAWAIRECLRPLWDYHYPASAKKYFDRWYSWACRCRLKPIVKVAKMIKTHLDDILTWCKHRITNAAAEGLNSRIQSLKSAARGFRSFANYRIRILFFCGDLDMSPLIPCHEIP
jgi:transposase